MFNPKCDMNRDSHGYFCVCMYVELPEYNACNAVTRTIIRLVI